MESLKTYKHVNHQNDELDFSISRMEDVYDASKGKVDDPHRHNFFIVLVVKKAKGCHFIDFNEYPLKNNELFFLSPGQVHQLKEDERSEGYALLFTEQFLMQHNISFSFIEDINLFNTYGDTSPLIVDDSKLEILSNFCDLIIELFNSDQKFKLEAIASYLKLLLIQSNELCHLEKEHTQLIESGNTIIRNFKDLLNVHYKGWHSVNEYANALNVSSDHLNRVIKAMTGKTSKEHIQDRIIIEAKRLLYFSELSAKEIAYELGFTEPANFSAFFKNCTGISPSNFLKQNVRK